MAEVPEGGGTTSMAEHCLDTDRLLINSFRTYDVGLCSGQNGRMNKEVEDPITVRDPAIIVQALKQGKTKTPARS
jgi:hypothetical protein